MSVTLDLALLAHTGDGFASGTLDRVLAAGLVEDLFLTRRFAWETQAIGGARIVVGDATPTGDTFLDGAFTALRPRRPTTAKLLITQFGKDLALPIREQAEQAGLLTASEPQGLFRRRTWFPASDVFVDDLLDRLRSAAPAAGDRAVLRLLAASDNLARVVPDPPVVVDDGDPVAAAVRALLT